MKNSSFWSRYAGIYDQFMKKDAKAYRQMIKMIRPVVKGKIVLELATGTGIIAKNILCDATMVEATDSSPEMIAQAKTPNGSSKLHFSVQDMFSLPYADESFPVIIAANVLHVIPNPEKALKEIRRVLTPDGILIVPTFTHGDSNIAARLKIWLMKRAGFPQQHSWTEEEYLDFLARNRWYIKKDVLIKASMPLTYVECVKMATPYRNVLGGLDSSDSGTVTIDETDKNTYRKFV